MKNCVFSEVYEVNKVWKLWVKYLVFSGILDYCSNDFSYQLYPFKKSIIQQL